MQTSGQAECGRPQNPTQSVSLGSLLPTHLKQFLLASFLVLSLKLHLLPSQPPEGTQKQSGMLIQAPALVLTGHAPRACLPTLLLNLTPQHKRWVSLSISSVGCPPERTLSWSTEA